jgi:hypothetical protein
MEQQKPSGRRCVNRSINVDWNPTSSIRKRPTTIVVVVDCTSKS